MTHKTPAELLAELNAAGERLDAVCDDIVMRAVGDVAVLPVGCYDDSRLECQIFSLAEAAQNEIRQALVKMRNAVACM